jgi:multimeric flavodoxin WrbA/DNA-directed RNA polymerase subunit RPC12/RpoP
MISVKILGLVSSPRRLGNSELAVKEIMECLPSDWEKKMIRISDLQIKPCRACYACLPVGKPCVLTDDLDFLLEHIRAADKIILAAPCYLLGAHTAVKSVMGRLLSIMSDFEVFEGKECALIMNYGIENWVGFAREDMMMFANMLNLKIVGDIMLHATLPGDCLKPQNLELLRRLARKLENPKDSFVTNSDGLKCPACGSRLMKLRADAGWECVICNLTGKLDIAEGQLVLKANSAEDYRFSRKNRLEHGDFLNRMREEFLRNRDEIKAVQQQYSREDLWELPKTGQ